MSDDEELETVVLDNGTCFTKAGFCGQDAPNVVLPTVVTLKSKKTNRKT